MIWVGGNEVWDETMRDERRILYVMMRLICYLLATLWDVCQASVHWHCKFRGKIWMFQCLWIIPAKKPLKQKGERFIHSIWKYRGNSLYVVLSGLPWQTSGSEASWPCRTACWGRPGGRSSSSWLSVTRLLSTELDDKSLNMRYQTLSNQNKLILNPRIA